jgi:hypothetical protein
LNAGYDSALCQVQGFLLEMFVTLPAARAVVFSLCLVYKPYRCHKVHS